MGTKVRFLQHNTQHGAHGVDLWTAQFIGLIMGFGVLQALHEAMGDLAGSDGLIASVFGGDYRNDGGETDKDQQVVTEFTARTKDDRGAENVLFHRFIQHHFFCHTCSDKAAGGGGRTPRAHMEESGILPPERRIRGFCTV